MSDVFSEGNKKEPVSNFFKFKTIGDKVSGKFVSSRERPAEGVYKAQTIYTLKKDDGEDVQVSISETKYWIIDAMKEAQVGQMVGFHYSADLEAKPGQHPAKVIDTYMSEAPKMVKQESKSPTVDETATSNDLPF